MNLVNESNEKKVKMMKLATHAKRICQIINKFDAKTDENRWELAKTLIEYKNVATHKEYIELANKLPVGLNQCNHLCHAYDIKKMLNQKYPEMANMLPSSPSAMYDLRIMDVEMPRQYDDKAMIAVLQIIKDADEKPTQSVIRKTKKEWIAEHRSSSTIVLTPSEKIMQQIRKEEMTEEDIDNIIAKLQDMKNALETVKKPSEMTDTTSVVPTGKDTGEKGTIIVRESVVPTDIKMKTRIEKS